MLLNTPLKITPASTTFQLLHRLSLTSVAAMGCAVQLACWPMLWTAPDVPPGAVDVVLGSDILYDPKLVPVVVRVLAHLLKSPAAAAPARPAADACGGITDIANGQGSNSTVGGCERGCTCSGQPDCSSCPKSSNGETASLQKRPVAYIVTTIRNPSTLQLFPRMADEAGMRVECMTSEGGIWSLVSGTSTSGPVLPALFQGIRALQDRRQYVMHRVTCPC